MEFSQWKERYSLSLDGQQEQAVQAVDGPVLLLAVPGSGKTTVLVSRVGYLCLARGIPPEQILTMTYTVAAARDMRTRFTALFGEQAAQRLDVWRSGCRAAGVSHHQRRVQPDHPHL